MHQQEQILRMTFQPSETPNCTFNAREFQNLDTLSTTGGDDGSVASPQLLRENVVESAYGCDQMLLVPVDESIAAYLQNDLNDEFFLEFEPGMMRTLAHGVDHEETVVSMPSDIGHVQFSFHLDEFTPAKIEELCQRVLDETSLSNIDGSIIERGMVMKSEPPSSLRPRYRTDGTRQVEKSRTDPMVVRLPSLVDVQLDSKQSFWLRLILATTGDSPAYLHTNKLEYHAPGVRQLSDGTTCVPLTLDDIRKSEKRLPRIAIVKTKLQAYDRDLPELDLTGPCINSGVYDKLTVAEAKSVSVKLNLKASRIICQLLIEQNGVYHFTKIVCQTKTLHEKTQPDSKKKQPAIPYDDDDDDDEQPSASKPAKRKKRSNN